GLDSSLLSPVKGVYAIQPVLHFNPPELASGPIDPRRRTCVPVSNLARRYKRVANPALRRRLSGVLWWAKRHIGSSGARRPAVWMQELRVSGTKVLVICGEDEARPFGATASPRQARNDQIQIEVIDGLDGALMPASQRRAVMRRLTDHLTEHFGRAEAPRPPARAQDPGEAELSGALGARLS
ncbi:MAG: hypothetical protein ACRDVP_07285, partial [Acidimicrobiales bacterium]